MDTTAAVSAAINLAIQKYHHHTRTQIALLEVDIQIRPMAKAVIMPTTAAVSAATNLGTQKYHHHAQSYTALLNVANIRAALILRLGQWCDRQPAMQCIESTATQKRYGPKKEWNEKSYNENQ